MTKLDDAVGLAIEAYQNRQIYPQRDAMKAAIQAAVKVLVPEESPSDSIYVGDAAWNKCRAIILKNAGLE